MPKRTASKPVHHDNEGLRGKALKRARNGETLRSQQQQARTEQRRRGRTMTNGRMTARDAALKVLEAADEPLSAAEVAKRMLAMKPAPVSGKYAQANAQKAVYNLAKDGEVKKTKAGFSIKQPRAAATA